MPRLRRLVRAPHARLQRRARGAALTLVGLFVSSLWLGVSGCGTVPAEQEGDASPASVAPGSDAPVAVAVVAEPEPPPRPGSFRSSDAFGHLRALVEIGPRASGTDGARAARDYVAQTLEAQGLEIARWTGDSQLANGNAVAIENLGVEVPAATDAPGSEGAFVLATAIDTASVPGTTLLGANEGASGTALVLEVTRAIAERPLPYPVRVVFLDGDRREPGRFPATEVAMRAAFEGARLVVYVDQVGDADLEIHRDLFSHRVYRDAFFDAAADLGLTDAFPFAVFDQVPAGHRILFKSGFRHVVALSDLRYGGESAPGSHWRTPADDLSNVTEESLGKAGRVVVAGLRRIAAHQLRVDAFVRADDVQVPDITTE